MATSKEMTAGPALPLILKFTLPLLLGNLLQQTYSLVDAAIVDDPPYLMRDGGMIKDGYNETVDNYRHAKTEGKQWLSELEASEREKTGIKNMKVKYNKVFGYYLEVTNSFKDLVPDYYTRKQTLTNAERYITPRLKELEDTILGAEDKLYALEYDLFCTVRDTVAGETFASRAMDRIVAFIAISPLRTELYYSRKGEFLQIQTRRNSIGSADRPLHGGGSAVSAVKLHRKISLNPDRKFVYFESEN